eukprot:COSAG02_NODE_4296_length_5538_cov_5.914690_3_plen_436_part_00
MPAPSPAPAPTSAVVHAEPIDEWTHKPLFTVTVHDGEHEFSLAHNEGDDLVVRVFNTNSGDRFEQVLTVEGIAQVLPADIPAGVKSLDGFGQFLKLALEREAGSGNPDAAQIRCESREERERYVVELSLETGSGLFANRYTVKMQIPLKNRATSNDKHLIALRTISTKFAGEIESQEDRLMEEIEELQEQLDLMKLQMNSRVFFGVSHSVHVDVENLTVSDLGEKLGLNPNGVVRDEIVANLTNGFRPGFSNDGNNVQRNLVHGWINQVIQPIADAIILGVTSHAFAAEMTTIPPLPSAQLEPLQLCRKLKSLKVPESAHGQLITDLDFLRGLPQLESLEINMPKIKDLGPLATLPNMKRLIITGLTLEGGGEIDVTPLAAITTLEEINFKNSPAVANVASLAKISTLQILDVTGTRVTDRRALAGCEGLRVIPE